MEQNDSARVKRSPNPTPIRGIGADRSRYILFCTLKFEQNICEQEGSKRGHAGNDYSKTVGKGATSAATRRSPPDPPASICSRDAKIYSGEPIDGVATAASSATNRGNGNVWHARACTPAPACLIVTTDEHMELGANSVLLSVHRCLPGISIRPPVGDGLGSL